MDKKYIVEYMGTLVIVTAHLLTESNPVIIGIVYFATLFTAEGITDGFFNPFVPLAKYMLNRGSTEDIMYNLLAQLLGGLSSILLFKPMKTILD